MSDVRKGVKKVKGRTQDGAVVDINNEHQDFDDQHDFFPGWSK